MHTLAIICPTCQTQSYPKFKRWRGSPVIHCPIDNSTANFQMSSLLTPTVKIVPKAKILKAFNRDRKKIASAFRVYNH